MTRRFSVPSLPFQSTLSMRRATDGILQREDGSFDFNPRSP